MAKGLLATQEAEYRRMAALRSAEARHREQRALREAEFAEPETYDARMQFSMGRPYTYGYERKMGVKPGLINHSTPQQPRLSGMQQMNGLPQALVQSSHSGLMNIPQPTPLVDSGKGMVIDNANTNQVSRGVPYFPNPNVASGMEHSDFLQQMQDYETLRGRQQITASPPSKPIAIKPEAAFRQSLPGLVSTSSNNGLIGGQQPTPLVDSGQGVVSVPDLRMDGQPLLNDEENEFAYIEQGLGLPPGLLYSLMMAETESFPENRDTVKSSAGAQGAFQLMPKTAERYGADRTNRHESAIAAGREIKWQLKSHKGDIDKALASYNYGHGNFRVKAGADLAKAPKETKQHRDRFHKYFDNFGLASSFNSEPMTIEQKLEQNAENTNTNKTP